MSNRTKSSVHPKRAGDNYSRTHHPEEPTTKKLKFDARNPSQLIADAEDEEDEAILEIDEIGKSAGTKRSAVNLDGYDSDSDNDNFDARAADRAKELKKSKSKEQEDQDSEEDDMFADLAEEANDKDDDVETSKKSKKAVRFLEENEIQGQNFSSKSGANVFDVTDSSGKTADVKEDDSEDDSESGGDEGRDYVESDDDAQELGAGGKKKHAPRLDAFNMKSEGEEGRFDETGNFVRRADPNAIHDSWMEGVSKKDMKKAKEAEEQREQERRQKDRQRDTLLTADLLSTLIEYLNIGESVLEALARLGKYKQKQKPKWSKKRHKDMMEIEDSNDAAESKRKADVEAITEAADALLSRGQEEIYDTERELLMRQYKRETGDDWAGQSTNTASGQWQFRWADARDGGDAHGPYDTATMIAWNEAGYFGQGVEFNQVGNDEWVQTAEFLS